MKKNNIYKLINSILFTVSLATVISVWLYWDNICGGHTCSLDLIDWYLTPLLWGGIAWSIIFGTLLAFPSSLFKRWLVHVGVWGMLAMLFVVLDTDPRSSSFWLDIDRGRAAWFTGVPIAFITALYIIGTYLYVWKKTHTTPTAWSRLLVLIPAALLMYGIAVW